MSNARDNRIKQLEEQNAELHKICARQRDSLAAQQETIVQLNVQIDNILICLCEKYGSVCQTEDGREARKISYEVNRHHGALDRCTVGAVVENGEYIITVVPKPQTTADGEV